MSHSAVEEILYLLGEAFAGKGIEESGESQSLLGNLRTVDERTWSAVPPPGNRSIADIVLHVAACKLIYVDYAFGPGTMTWEDPRLSQRWEPATGAMDEVVGRLREAHAALVGHVGELHDSELAKPRRTNWGEDRETRWLISTLMQHDLYHAGEINHIRSLLAADDVWMWERYEAHASASTAAEADPVG